LTAVPKADAGKVPAPQPATWFAAPFDIAFADHTGTVSFYNPGEVLVGVVIGGKVGFTRIKVKPAPVTTIEIGAPGLLVVGGACKLAATARTAEGNPRVDVPVSWSSSSPEVATVDAPGLVVTMRASGATIQAPC